MNPTRIAVVVGLGYVGLPLAVEFGKLRHRRLRHQRRPRVRELREGRDSALECSAEELAAAAPAFSDQLADIAACTVYIVTVPHAGDRA